MNTVEQHITDINILLLLNTYSSVSSNSRPDTTASTRTSIDRGTNR